MSTCEAAAAGENGSQAKSEESQPPEDQKKKQPQHERNEKQLDKPPENLPQNGKTEAKGAEGACSHPHWMPSGAQCSWMPVLLRPR